MALLIPVSVLAFALNAALTRTVQLKYPVRKGLLRMYQALFCVVAAIVFAVSYLVGMDAFHLGAPEILYGLVFGVFYFVATVGSSTGYEIGSMSLTSIIMNMSLFIPLVYSCMMDKALPTPIQYVGIALILVTMMLAINPGKKKEGGTSVKWFLIVLLAFFANGITAVTQKHYTYKHGEGGLMLFMAIAYLVSALLFLAGAFLVRRKSGEKLLENLAPVSAMSAVSGLGSYGGNALLGILSAPGGIQGPVLYPCVNGGLCIVSALCSFLFFKEKPSARKLTAIGIGIVAIVLLNL